MLIREVSWLDGWPIPYCFYDFAYFHDIELSKSNPAIHQLIVASNYAMEKIYGLTIYCKKYLELKSDDMAIAHTSFLKIDKTDKQIMKDYEELMKVFSKDIAKIKSKQRLKTREEVRRSGTEASRCTVLQIQLTSQLGSFGCFDEWSGKQPYLTKTSEDGTRVEKSKIEGLINTCLKALEVIKRTTKFREEAKGVFDRTNIVGIATDVPIRNMPMLTLEQSVQKLTTYLEQILENYELEHISDCLTLLEKWEQVNKKESGFLVSAQLVSNSFDRNNFSYFGKLKWEDLIKKELKYYKYDLDKRLKSKKNDERDISDKADLISYLEFGNSLQSLFVSMASNRAYLYNYFDKYTDLTYLVHLGVSKAITIPDQARRGERPELKGTVLLASRSCILDRIQEVRNWIRAWAMARTDVSVCAAVDPQLHGRSDLQQKVHLHSASRLQRHEHRIS